MAKKNYILIPGSDTNAVPIKAWTKGVPVEATAEQQLRNVAKLDVVYPWVAAMPDVHYGIGATVGSVIPTKKAIIPAAVGVDIGCGMMAVKTSLKATDLPSSLSDLRSRIEDAIPHGRTDRGGNKDKGAFHNIPKAHSQTWTSDLEPVFKKILAKYPKLANAKRRNDVNHLGTLGGGNHFIEVCLDENKDVWLMLHSGSRGIGNRIGTFFIELARRDMEGAHGTLPDLNLAYFREGTEHFDDYVQAVGWAQDFARLNRELMMKTLIKVVQQTQGIPPFTTNQVAINCHHNYVQRETHFDEKLWVTRKGAVRARAGELAIIPGSMGTRSYIVRGKGNPESFESCSHGAGRTMSRSEAKKRFTLSDHKRATEGVECRKDTDVLDETPQAYKDIDTVMAAQQDLVEIAYTLKQILCVKG